MGMNKRATKLERLIAKQDKRIEKFQTESTAMFHPYAVELCKKIKKGIPEFEGCQLGMRKLFLEPLNLMIPYKHVVQEDGIEAEDGSERLQNLLDYYLDEWNKEWKFQLSAATLQALVDLDELANYIDDNYSNVNELCVTKEELE